MNGVGYVLPMGLCHYQVRFQELIGVLQEKSGKRLFHFTFDFPPVIYSRFAVFCWSVMKGVGCCLAGRAFQYEIYCKMVSSQSPKVL